MIKTIKVRKTNKTIPKDFELDLKSTTVITGKNNSGKTNFVEAVASRDKEGKLDKVEFIYDDEQGIEPEIIYIKAENIKPSDDALKPSIKTSWMVESLSKLFQNAGFEIKLNNDDRDKIEKVIVDLKKRTDQNLEDFAGYGAHKININIAKNELDSKLIIQALIESITVDENGHQRKLDDLGQGTQRLIVVSVFKAYCDMLVESEVDIDKPVLIIFEEPEIYLHPELKRSLNSTLENIASKDNHQVLITTHDPYFAFKNYNTNDKSVISFEKGDDGLTSPPKYDAIEGVEDELLFIFLYSLLEKRIGNVRKIPQTGKFEPRKYFSDRDSKDLNFLTYIRDQIHHSGCNEKTIGLISSDGLNLDNKNYYTPEEFSEAIKEMCKMINEKKVEE